jgi:hypothetical protein
MLERWTRQVNGPLMPVAGQFEEHYIFVIPNRRSLPVRNLMLAWAKQIPCAIKPLQNDKPIKLRRYPNSLAS